MQKVVHNNTDGTDPETRHLNEYGYNDIYIGQTEMFCVEITEKAQSMFLALSGDINPMHISEEYAQSQGFPGKLVYGMATAAYYSALAGTLLPGKNCLLNGIDIKFRKPVFINDKLTITGECVKKNDTFRLITIKATIRNQNNELVSSAELTVGVLNVQPQ